MFDENYIGQFSQKMNKLRENRNRSAEPSHLYRPRIPVLLHLHALNILAGICSLIAQDIGIALVLRVTDISVKKLHICLDCSESARGCAALWIALGIAMLKGGATPGERSQGAP